MKILLLGKNGQVGSNIIKNNKDYLFELLPFSKNELDITDFKKVEMKINTIQPDIIINATAYNQVELAEDSKFDAFQVNEMALDLLSSNCNKLNIPLIHLSTDFVFDGNSNTPYKENDQVNPLNTYGKSKLGGENIIKKNHDKYIILRTSWVFSEIGSNFLKTILKLLETKDTIRVINNQKGSPTSAQSIAKVILKIVKLYHINKNLTWGTFHFSGYPYCSWFDFAEEISSQYLNLFGFVNIGSLVPILSKQYNTKVKRPLNSSLDCSKIKKTYGIEQDDWKISLISTIKDLYAK